MDKIMPGHLIGFGSVAEMDEYEDYVWLGGAMSELRYGAYRDTPSKQECNRICEELSGDCITITKEDML